MTTIEHVAEETFDRSVYEIEGTPSLNAGRERAASRAVPRRHADDPRRHLRVHRHRPRG